MTVGGYNLIVTYDRNMFIHKPTTLHAVATDLGGYGAKVSQFSVGGNRRTLVYLVVSGAEQVADALADANKSVRRHLALTDGTVIYSPAEPLRTTPRQGRVFHRAALTRTPASITTHPPTEEPVTIEPTDINRKKKKKAKKLRKAKAKHPATVAPTLVTNVVTATDRVVGFTPPMRRVEPATPLPTTGRLRYYKSADGDHRWSLSSNNSKKLAQAEGFTAVGKATGNIDAVRRALVNPKIEFDPESYPNRQ